MQEFLPQQKYSAREGVTFIANLLLLLSSSGGKEAVWQGNRKILLCAGKKPEPVLQEEGIAAAGGLVSDPNKATASSSHVCSVTLSNMLWLRLLQADAQMGKDRQVFYDASLQYVFKIQEVQERKKFEFVEPVSTFITASWQLILGVQTLMRNCSQTTNEGVHAIIEKHTLHTLFGRW